MRFAVAVVVAAIGGLAQPGSAESSPESDSLVNEGIDLAKQGDHQAAIDRFNRANGIAERASTHCNIGLAYLKLRAWAQADYHLAECDRQWEAEDGDKPDWLADNRKTAVTEMRRGSFGTLEITTRPSTATVVVAPFPGRRVHGRLWLPAGRHEVRVSAPGYQEQRLELVVEPGGRVRQAVSMERLAKEVEPANDVSSSSSLGLVVGIASIVVGAGMIPAGLYFRSAASDRTGAIDTLNGDYLSMTEDQLSEADYRRRYQELEDQAKLRNRLMVGSFVAGAVLVGIGGYLVYDGLSSEPNERQISIGVGPGGAMVSRSWSF
ncbi:MAG: PEGA domain-containing protein [Deltaproteobacteria bacterium]|nr:PEGA domain-containing protein [Deltaproteobacteria bacterium]